MFRVWAYCGRRDGRPIPRWQLNTVKWVQGNLTLHEERDDWLGRRLKVARLQRDGRGTDLFPPLLEAQVLMIDDTRIILNGVERDELSRSDRAQTWVLHITERVPVGRVDGIETAAPKR